MGLEDVQYWLAFVLTWYLLLGQFLSLVPSLFPRTFINNYLSIYEGSLFVLFLMLRSHKP